MKSEKRGQIINIFLTSGDAAAVVSGEIFEVKEIQIFLDIAQQLYS